MKTILLTEEEVCEYLKKEIEQEKSVLAFARQAGVAQSGLAAIKHGAKVNVTFKTLARVAFARGIRLSKMFRELEQEAKKNEQILSSTR